MSHMTQTTEPPVLLTLESMLGRFRDKHIALVGPFEDLKPELERGEGAQPLANLIGCEVDLETRGGLHVYGWRGQTGRFELQVPRPFDPEHRRREPEEPSAVPTTGEATPPGPSAEPEPPAAPPPGAEPEPEPAPAGTPGLFAALAALLGDATLLLTVAKTGEADGAPLLSVTVVPHGDAPGLAAVGLEGTAGELDAHFVAALTAKADGRKRIEDQIEALKAADRALEEAKKAEVAAKTKQADAKKKAVKDKEAQANTQLDDPATEAPPPQAALF